MKRYNITPQSMGPAMDDTLRIKVTEADNGKWVKYEDALDMDRRLQYAGAIGLLCECSVRVDEDTRECIHQAVDDFCKLTGWTYRRILDRIEVEPPS